MIAPLSSEKRNRTCNIYHHSDMFACWYVDISSCFPTAVGLAVRNNRHEYLRFLFSPVYNPFQQHFADFRRPERFNTESEGGYRFEVVNLRAVFVRYADNALYVIYAQNSAFAESLYPCPNRRGDNPEQFAPISLGREILPCPSIVIMFLSSFIGILFLIRWLGRYSSPYPPTCATRFPCLGLSSGR